MVYIQLTRQNYIPTEDNGAKLMDVNGAPCVVAKRQDEVFEDNLSFSGGDTNAIATLLSERLKAKVTNLAT